MLDQLPELSSHQMLPKPLWEFLVDTLIIHQDFLPNNSISPMFPQVSSWETKVQQNIWVN